MKNTTSLSRPYDDPLPADVHDLDAVTFLFFYHDTTYMNVDRAQMDRKLFAALKPGGVLVIADHAAKAGEEISVGKTLHRIDEGALRREVEAAGFKLVGRRRFLAPSRRYARLHHAAADRAGRQFRAEVPEAVIVRRCCDARRRPQ